MEKNGSRLLDVPKVITLDYLDKLDRGEIIGSNGRIGWPFTPSSNCFENELTAISLVKYSPL